jgi:hypothetical protein
MDEFRHQFVDSIKSGKYFDQVGVGVGIFLVEYGTQESCKVLWLLVMGLSVIRIHPYLESVLISW